MMDNDDPDTDDPDIVDRIDEPTEPGPDAATWTPDNTPAQPQWTQPSPGSMVALLITRRGPTVVQLARDDPREQMSRLLDDTRIKPLTHLSGVGFWVGCSAHSPKDPNYSASVLLADVLDDAVNGDYVIADKDRDRILDTLDDPAEPPLIHEPCLLTGIDADGTPAALPDALARWIERAMQRHQAEIAEAISTLAAHAGINPHDIRGIAFIRG